MTPGNEFILRPATRSDIPALVDHRRRMFEDMAKSRGSTLEPANLDAADEVYTGYLQTHLADDSLYAWVFQVNEQIVASGAVSIIQQYPPHYTNLAGNIPLLHSVYTLPAYRRKGLARRIVQQAIDFCRGRGFTILRLHTSHEGQPLYESLGFQITSEMQLILRNTPN